VLTLECHIPRDAKNCPVIDSSYLAGASTNWSGSSSLPILQSVACGDPCLSGRYAQRFRQDCNRYPSRQSVLDEKRFSTGIETRSESIPNVCVTCTSMGAIKNTRSCRDRLSHQGRRPCARRQDLANILAYTKDVPCGPVFPTNREAFFESGAYLANTDDPTGVRERTRGIEWDPKNLAPYVAPEKYSSFSAHATASSRSGQVSRSERIWEAGDARSLSGHYTSFLTSRTFVQPRFSFFERRSKE